MESAAPPVAEKSKPSTNDPLVAEELRVRDGLPNLFAKLKAGGPVRIAYLGGSITAAEGWRVKTTAWFKAQYPKAEIIEIDAAISGTGSDYGACRVASDVLEQKPDLVFMEHRVNGGGGFEAKSVEGIVRQIWQANPHTDLCLIHTISEPMLKDLQAGRPPRFGNIMETIANTYGIPSIDLGVEIARREKAKTLIPQGDGMELEVTIDQQPPVTLKRLQTDKKQPYARFFYLPEQAPGEHTAVIKIKSLPKGTSYYAGQLLIVGKVMP